MAIKKTTAHEIIDSQDNIWPPAMIQNGEWVYQEINNLPDEVNNNQNKDNKSNENKSLPKSETLPQNSKEFPSVQLSVKNPISSKILVFLMILQVFSNIGIFMLLLNVLE